jgi:small subunit ribosomal protein S20
MPILRSAIKKLKQDKKRTLVNRAKKDATKKQIKLFLKTKTEADLKKSVSMIDKLAKINIFHKNKAARLKAKLSKQLKK